MLQALTISNYALIEQLQLHFYTGFSVVTGETGSGKSIMLDALSLVLGERADSQSLRNKDKKCIVEAQFRLNESFRPFFEDHNLDYDLETTLRREITPSGKSRAFINDTPVNLQQLKKMAERLVDLHSQHQTLKIREAGFQMSILDAFAQNETLLQQYKKQYKLYLSEQRILENLQAEITKARADFDYLKFQLEELQAVKLDGLHLASAERELEMQVNAEEIKRIASDVANGLINESGSIVDQLAHLKQELIRLSHVHSDFKSHAERLNSAFIELKDISEDLNAVQESLEHDPQKIATLTETVNSVNRLLTKHQASDVAQLIELRTNLQHKMSTVSHADEDLGKQKNNVQAQLLKLQSIGKKLKQRREEAILPLQEKLEGLLAKMNMPNCHFSLKLIPLDIPSSNGFEALELLVRTNKGSSFSPLHKAASGGELSRIVFALKWVLSTDRSLNTIIFDEIDTGISGDVASKMGDLMKEMGQHMQVISITHLPQIAGKGAQHYRVSKSIEGEQTLTQVKRMSKEERMVEIATMLSGQNPTEAALNNAKELLN